jgi:hypothetical protein
LKVFEPYSGETLAMLGAESRYRDTSRNMTEAARRLLRNAHEAVQPLAENRRARDRSLGAGCLYGAGIESHFKGQEMVDVRALRLYDSSAGSRHPAACTS